MSQMVSVLAALGASASASVAAALQARSARRAADPQQGAVNGLLRFARSQLARRLWWGSLAVQGIGLGLHAVALRTGALTVVQALMASAVVLALPLNHLLSRTRVTPRELSWAALLAAGLAGFLISSATRRSTGPAPSSTAVVIAALVAVAAIASCIARARHQGHVEAAALLGTAAAVAFAAEAASLQRVAGLSSAGWAAILTSFATYTLVVAGAAGVFLTQLAYRAGPMAAALPAIILVNPLVSGVFGVVVQHDTFRHSPAAIILEALTLGMLLVGALQLTRHPSPG